MIRKKLKLSDEHHILVEAIAKDLGISFRRAGEIVMNQGFNFIGMLFRDDDKILETYKIIRSDKSLLTLMEKNPQYKVNEINNKKTVK